MLTFFGIVVVLFGLLGWGGQLISFVAPAAAGRLGLTEPEETVDPVFWADVRAEALWDSLVLWPLPLAGVLILAGCTWWPPVALLGGGMYLYFAGRGVFQRVAMQRRGISVGEPASVRINLIMLVVWGALGAASVIMGLVEWGGRA
jgi:hypothetical protein